MTREEAEKTVREILDKNLITNYAVKSVIVAELVQLVMKDRNIINDIEGAFDSIEDIHKQNAEAINIQYKEIEKESKLKSKFSLFISNEKLALNHYSCDTDIFLESIDIYLDDLCKVAIEHLKKCTIED